MVHWQRNVFAIATATFVGFMAFTIVMPFLPLYLQHLGVRDVREVAMWSGLSIGVTPAITASLAPFWGRVADRFGRKLMVERSLVSFIFLMGGMAYATEAWHILAFRAAQGLFAGYGGMALAMAAESAPRDRTADALGTVQTAQRLGPAVGPVLGGVVAQAVGMRNAFFVTSAFYVVALAIVFFLYDERRAPAAPAQARVPVRFRSILGFENFVLLMAVVFAIQLVDRSYGPILPLYLAQVGVPADRVALLAGIIFSMAAVAGALGNQLGARLLRRWAARRVITAAALAASVAAAIFAIAPGATSMFLATPLLGLALGAASTATYTAASAVMPPASRGSGFGLLSTASLLALALSPMLSGVLAATGIRVIFIVDVVIMLVVATTVSRLMVLPHGERTAAPAAEEF